MSISVGTIRKAATTNPAAAAAAWNREELYGAIDQIGREIRKVGETIEQARTRAQQTPEGEAIMKAYRLAPCAPSEPPAPVAKGASVPGADILAKIQDLANGYMKANSSLTPAAARTMAWQARPDLKAQYDAQRRAAIAGRASA